MAINLLPWREQRHRVSKRNLLITVAIYASATLIIGVGWNWQIKHRLASQQRQIKKWDIQIKELNKKLIEIQKARNHATNRNNNLLSSEADSKVLLAVLQNLPVIMPLNLYITELIQEGRSMQIIGYADSSDSLFTFEKKLPALKNGLNVHINQVHLDENKLKFYLEAKW